MAARLKQVANEAEPNGEKRKGSRCAEKSRYGRDMLSLGDLGLAFFPGSVSATIAIRPVVSPGMG